MIRHRIYVRHSEVEAADKLSIHCIKRSVRAALFLEGADIRCEVNVMVTCDRDMREINYSCRGVDMTTDVLSFPMHYLVPGNFEVAADAADRETGLFLLGDIVLSAERVILQAQEYGRTKKQETAYLTVHSVLHLLGYDHMDEAEDKRKMRGREKEIMRRLGMQEE